MSNKPKTTHEYLKSLEQVLKDERYELRIEQQEAPDKPSEMLVRCEALQWAIDLASEVLTKSHANANSKPQFLIDKDGSLITLKDVIIMRRSLNRANNQARFLRERVAEMEATRPE